jgi:hypothetical protein
MIYFRSSGVSEMRIRGRIQNGAVVLEAPVALPEGAEVECILLELEDENGRTSSDSAPGNFEDLLKYAGVVKDTPADLSRNLDHYLYGAPKE